MKHCIENKDPLARELYHRYCTAVGGKAFNGEPLPDWESFSSDQQKRVQAEGWRVVAEAAIKLLEP